MANYANLEAAIQAAIYENNTNDITGAALQSVLLQMVSSMGKSGMLCNGVADSSTTPPVNPDSNIFYIAPTGTYPNFGGLVVADGEWAIFIYNGSWQKQSIPVVTTDAVPTTGSTNPVQSGGVADALEQKADIDGYYSTLTAGAAENLVGRGSVLAEYTRRTSGGSADIGSGAATIEKIHGNSVAWNQQVTNGNFATNSDWAGLSGTVSISSGVGTYTITTVQPDFYSNQMRQGIAGCVNGHKYYYSIEAKASKNMFLGGLLFGARTIATNGTSFTKFSGVTTYTGTTGTHYLYMCFDSGVTRVVGDSFDVRNIFLVDLTLAGLDTLSAAEFEALFPLNYYAHNTGSLMNLTATGVQTNGFNQWDEEWEVYAGTRIKSKNPIPVFPSTTYYLEIPSPDVANVDLYDVNLNFISTMYNVGNSTFTTPANCRYLLFYVLATYGNVYKNDICINLSDTARNGEYEAYWSSTLNLPLISVASGGSAVFADGMKGIGGVYDELTSSKAVKRIGIVNLGNLTDWEVYSNDTTGHTFRATLTGAKAVPNESTVANIKAAIYTTRQFNWPSDWMNYDKVVCQTTAAKNLLIRDTAYSNAATFKTAMNGVYLYYELATPVEYTLDSEINLNYRVDNLGTEAEVPQNTATPTTAPIVYDVRYAMNAVDTLRNLPTNYISKDSLKNLLDAFVSAGVISAYTMTYNAGTKQYTFTITA